ncbi:MAG: caspase family protein [Nostoc sp.]|uniref:HD domain-containing protein n=1 Tax=Nostoc sp. TaxID=1180 RepID=UPI002FF8F0AD
MKKRRALLIGVPEYESDAITNLPIVCRDIENLHASLEKSGFTIRSLGTDGISQTGRSKLLQALRRECKEAQGVETLLLYFSGHGMHYRGKDYLIPSDAVLDDAEYVEEYLVSTDIGDIIDQSGAETIIFFIDACREGVKLGFKDTYLAGWSRGDRRQALQRSFIMVFACGPGQVSQYVGNEQGFSLFSKALAEVLDPQHFACTLKEVLDETQARLNTLIAEQGKQSQKIYYASESAVDDNILSRVICESVTAAAVKGKASDPWSEAALQSQLWKNKGTEANSIVAQLKQQVAKVLAACWQEWKAAINSFPQDQWRDETLPIRVLEALDLLVFRSDPPIELTDAETALVVTAPFVREAVLASGLVQVAKANPLSLEETNPKTGLRSGIDKVHQSNPRLVRKAQRLQDQGRTGDKDIVMTWLLHRCLLKTLELWMPESEGGQLSSNLLQSLQSVSQCSSRLTKETLTPKRLLELARCLFADVERISRDDRPEALQPRLTVGGYSEEQQIREKMVAYLLKLAGLLAIDIRTLPDVLIDHIGLSDPLTPNDISCTIAKARWNPSGRGRTLCVTCLHPAVDLVMQEHVEQANLVLTHILRQVEVKRVDMEMLVGLPVHLSPDGIIAEKQNGVAVYQTPHVNFQLAHDEVRELLMGEQLYGDPRLAIRELYQNALDACRYRKARLTYLKQTGKYQGQDQTWEGRIIFRQAKDENGREYIECEDNGIGMGKQHLSQCFARAGRRFADLPEFIEEQAEWLKCNPPIRLYPNSQFGVGVLSYFMLADEIELETCRLDRKGKPEQKLRVRIPGSSGLFRVQELAIGVDSGTRVRLYLNRTHYENQLISCVETLRELLWVAQFRTEAQHSSKQEIWEPEQLKHPELTEDKYLKVGDTDVWWVASSRYSEYDKQGCILSDGLFTGERQTCFIVNLRGNNYPKLTVDRTEIVELDKEWISHLLIHNSEALIKWQHLNFQWLWSLSDDWTAVAAHIFDVLSINNVSIKLGRWHNDTLKLPIAEIGCFAGDAHLLSFDTSSFESLFNLFGMPWWLFPYRLFLWKQYGLNNLSLSLYKNEFIEIQPDFCPIPTPEDSLILSCDLEHPHTRYPRYIQGKISIAQIILSSIKLNKPLSFIIKQLQRFAFLGLEVTQVEPEIVDNLNLTLEDINLFKNDLGFINHKLFDDKISVAYIVRSAQKLGHPIDTIFKRLQRFETLGLQLPKVNLQYISELSIIPEDILLLSSNLDGKTPLREDKISVIHLILASQNFSEPIASIIVKLKRFEVFGLKLPQLDLETIKDISITEQDLIAISKNLDGKAPFLEEISTIHLIIASDRLNESIANTFKRLQKLEVLKIKLPSFASELLDNISITSEDIILFSKNLNGNSPWLEVPIFTINIIIAANSLGKSIDTIINQLKKFEPLGLKVPLVSLYLSYSQSEIRKYLLIFSKSMDGEAPWIEDDIHPTRVLLAALIFNESIEATLERLRTFAPLIEVNFPEGNEWFWQFLNKITR